MLGIGVAVAVGFGLTTTAPSPTVAHGNESGWHELGDCSSQTNSNGWCAWSCTLVGHSGNGAHCCVTSGQPDECYCYE